MQAVLYMTSGQKHVVFQVGLGSILDLDIVEIPWYFYHILYYAQQIEYICTGSK